MDKIIIEGGVSLNGKIKISGSKNSALPCLFATLLTDEECVLENVPDLDDIATSCSLLTFLGKKVIHFKDKVIVASGKSLYAEAPYELVRKMRASALVLGPLLARLGKAAASLPGGCAIGNRPINIHLEGFEKLGAKIDISGGDVKLNAKKLKGRKIALSFPSVGATENLLMASALTEGETILTNVAREPEIVDCATFLNKMGAQIQGAGSKVIIIRGKKSLHGAEHSVIPDRIETATYLIAAAATKGKIVLTHAFPKHNRAVLQKLSSAGLKIKISQNQVENDYCSIACTYNSFLKPVSITTGPYPEFPTDVQAQWMALMAITEGKSVIKETIFENRYLHAAELCRMGAKIKIQGNQAAVQGVKNFSGAEVMVSDLRAGAAMIIAALAARGKTVVHRIYHLDRGYENLELKLRKVGAKIRRVH